MIYRFHMWWCIERRYECSSYRRRWKISFNSSFVFWKNGNIQNQTGWESTISKTSVVQRANFYTDNHTSEHRNQYHNVRYAVNKTVAIRVSSMCICIHFNFLKFSLPNQIGFHAFKMLFSQPTGNCYHLSAFNINRISKLSPAEWKFI